MLFAMLFAAPASVGAEDTARPHIVLFLADDLSWSDCPIYNRDCGIEMPHLADLASRGMTFTNAFVASPSCAPSRAALLTGLSPVRNGAMFNHTLPDKSHRRWPHYFRVAGYETAAIGKVAHYSTVTQYGFDHASHHGYHQDECIDAAVKWLAARKSQQPLCLLVGTNWPHVPWPSETKFSADGAKLLPTWIDTPEFRKAWTQYAQAVDHVDRDLGKIVAATKRHLGDNVLFLFTSDHGAQLPFGKWNCYDAGIRTPLVAVWPGKIAAGSKSGELVSWVDLLPTCLDVAQAKVPAEGIAPGELSGRSLLPLVLGDKPTAEPRRFIAVSHSGDGEMNDYPMRAIRTADWKYIRNLAPEREFHTHIDRQPDREVHAYWPSWQALATKYNKAAVILQRYHTRPAEELYDLAADPHEQHNLAAQSEHSERLSEMRATLDTWMKANGDEGLATEARRKPPIKKAKK